eukprot:TRINITY_DN12562_c0_g1_i1.p1 TRINITY_DN12562_c0_g1~~TRINITY_DN12562_c0_g1_i1.p1  ORF type:complete len:144 (-),score=19.44 TRINITY_DN12562_c0_g1_i1:299-730(-)
MSEGAGEQEKAPSAVYNPKKKSKLSFEDKLELDYVLTATANNVWYYRDRMNVPRGPCTVPVLRNCWVQGVIDENTIVWGQGLADWLPAKNVKTLVAQIRTFEVRAAAWIKREFALKPAIKKLRKVRANERPEAEWVDQVESMR